MARILYFSLLFFFFIAQNTALAQEKKGEIMGRLIDFETGEAIPFANVSLELNGKIAGVQTDFDGFYSIKPLPIGVYNINIQMYEYEKLNVLDIPVLADSVTVFHAMLASDSLEKNREMPYQAPTAEDLLNFKKLIKSNGCSVAPINCFAAPSFWEKEKNERRSLQQIDWQREIERAVHKTNNRYIFE